MGLLGESWDDPKTAAILGLAGGLLGGNPGAGIQNALQGAQRQAQINAYNKRQDAQDAMDAEKFGIQKQQWQMQLDAGKQKAFDEQRVRALLPKVMTGEIDPATAITQGVPTELVKQIFEAKSPNFGKPAPVKLAAGEQMFDPTSGKALFGQPKEVDPNKPFMVVDGKIVPNTAYQQFDLEKASRSAAKTNVTVDAAPKAFWQDFGKNASDQLFKERDSAQAAAGTLQSIAEIRRAVQGGAYQGAGADLKLGASKVMQSLGMPYDAKTVANTELFNAQANNFVLDRIKTLGANPSNADREFIEKTVPRLSTDPAALPQLLDFMERKGTAAVNAYNTKIRNVQNQPNGQSIPMSLEVPVPEMPSSPGPSAVPLPSNPTASNLKRGTVYDTPRGRAVWDGMQFKKVD